MSGALNAYEVLGVEPDADAETIKRAARQRARETHPDHGGDAEAFRAVRDAWNTLRDPARRAMHDAELARRGAAGPDWDAVEAGIRDRVRSGFGDPATSGTWGWMDYPGRKRTT